MLKITDVKKSYVLNGVAQKVLDGLTFNLSKGDIAGISGPSGSGKSTLLHIAGLIDTPDSGSVEINGLKVNTLSSSDTLKFRNKKIGFVFQHHFLIPELSVWQNVCYCGAVSHNCFNAELKKNASELLNFLGIRELSDRSPEKLSGGESQRVAIARAIFNSPEILLMDEPTGSLDSDNKKEVMQLILKLVSDLKTTVLIASHDDYIINKCAKRLKLFNGKITC